MGYTLSKILPFRRQTTRISSHTAMQGMVCILQMEMLKLCSSSLVRNRYSGQKGGSVFGRPRCGHRYRYWSHAGDGVHSQRIWRIMKNDGPEERSQSSSEYMVGPQ